MKITVKPNEKKVLKNKVEDIKEKVNPSNKEILDVLLYMLNLLEVKEG